LYKRLKQLEPTVRRRLVKPDPVTFTLKTQRRTRPKRESRHIHLVVPLEIHKSNSDSITRPTPLEDTTETSSRNLTCMEDIHDVGCDSEEPERDQACSLDFPVLFNRRYEECSSACGTYTFGWSHFTRYLV
jgi:hypothetical protein